MGDKYCTELNREDCPNPKYDGRLCQSSLQMSYLLQLAHLVKNYKEVLRPEYRLQKRLNPTHHTQYIEKKTKEFYQIMMTFNKLEENNM